jgi:hypothetical protein
MTAVDSGHRRRRAGSRPIAAVVAVSACMIAVSAAHAQGSAAEAPDPTRLDVERLPPEAIAVTRDMFAHGLFVTGLLGGRGFAGGVGRLSRPGPFARVGLGYELADFFALAAAFELSLHETDAAPPPSASAFQVIDVLVEARLSWPWSARAALWLAGELGIDWIPGNLLTAYGLEDADSSGFIYGGSLGFDWHLLSRHHSLGLLAGARLYPNLAGAGGEAAVGIHSAAYLQYVF